MKNKNQNGNTKKTLNKILCYMRPYRCPLIIAFVLSIIGSLLSVISPEFIGRITTVIQKGLTGAMDMPAVWQLMAINLMILGIALIIGYIQNYMMVTITQRSSKRMRSDLNNKLDNMPLSYFDRSSYGDTLSRMTNDVDTLATTLNSNVSAVFTGVVTILGCVIMMFATNWVMALSSIIATLLGLSASIIITKKSQPYFQRQQNELGKLNGQIEEVFSGHAVVRAFNSEHDAAEVFHECNQSLYMSTWKSQFLAGLMSPVMTFVGNLGYVVVCIVGAILVLKGHIGIGVIVSFMIYVRLFTSPLSNLAQSASGFQLAIAAGDRVFSLLEEEELSDEVDKNYDLATIAGDVDFQNVQFGYTPGQTILKDFSAKVKAGQKVAIVGPTGAGKTTMINLLLRFYEVSGGRICIDNIPIDQMSRAQISELFSMVPQDTWLFEGTLKDNIRYGNQNMSDQDVKDICKEVGLHRFIKTLPHGYDTILDETVTLSAGQKQLMTIARAMAENAQLLILDEATSSVDTRTEKIIQAAVDKLTKGRTSFIIAHRLSTIRNADLIFVMKDGNIIETGNHDELLETGGFYAQLYNSQFEPVA